MRLVEIFQQREPKFTGDQPTSDMAKVASFKTDLSVADALSEAFRLTNVVWEDEPTLVIEPGDHRSTSIGDVVVVDGLAFQCQGRGWSRLDGFRPG